MVYFMIKLVVVGLMSAGLVACGGGGGGGESSSGSNTDPTQLNTPTANILTVKGTGVNKQEAITVDNKDISIIATGNQPVDRVSFFPKGLSADKVPPGWFGSIHFSYNYKAQIGYLDFHDKTNAYLSCSLDACLQNSSYDFQVGTQQTLLTFNFDQAPNTYHYQVNGKDRTTPVKLSGNLQFTFPSNWPVLQLPRFPKAVPQGEFYWSAYPYNVFAFPVSEKNATTNRWTHTLMVEQDDSDLFTLKITELSATSFKISMTDDFETYSANVVATKSPWQENDKVVNLTIGEPHPQGYILPLELWNEDGTSSQNLKARLVIPRAIFDFTIDGKSPGLVQFQGAYAENENKYYQLRLEQRKGGSTAYSIFNINQALDGHLWLSYFVDKKSLSCGGPDKACAGLSVDSDQHTYRLSNVKVGDFTIDGTAYIPGVLK